MDDYDEDNYDIEDELYSDYDDDDGFENNLDDDEAESDNDRAGHDLAYYEDLGIEDGRFDKDHHMLPQSGFGSSVNLDELTDDEREAYEMGYSLGAEDYDLSDDN